ncbi:hypothetical protein [Bacillus sp. FJAT-42315]|uniref:hypothetical protein n=1 Tax=Bacillus sp. FJAT-42315 TaxID=2014077 RepID=UPI000C24D407|nr:hypothetical protein [Bacillus sp. FJAT-42315]
MSRFQPSINIVYDIGKAELFDQFVPNLNQLDIIEKVLSGVLDDQRHSHLLIGPYGAGKSMVGALITSLLSARKKSKDVKSFLDNVSTVSPDFLKNITSNLELKKMRWIPIAITGKSGDFEKIILDSILSNLKKQDITISLKGDSEQILKTVALWQREYKFTYKHLEEYCHRIDISLEEMLKKIKAGDEELIIEFKKMYPHLTSGATFISEADSTFSEQIDHILKQLNSKKVGLFIVYDEFGRFLQTVNQAAIYQTMQSMQDLAEMANRVHNMGLLFITHTGLKQYASANNSLSKSELERVEKRFQDHRLESDPAVFFRSAFKILESVRRENSGNLFLYKDIDELKGDIIKYNLFPEMSPSEIDGAILEGCQPIHPLAIRLLPVLSNVLGQNDRTLYTFLTHLDEDLFSTTWYYADRLFDYFYPDESAFYLIEDLKFYRLAMTYQLSEEAKRLVKLVTLLNIINRPFSINSSFLSFALGLSEKIVSAAIEQLIEFKLIRYNRFSASYELFSGSIVEFESIFKEFKSSIVISDTRRLNYVDRIFNDKYYLPLAYNSEKSMTRYIEAKFSWKEQLDTLEINGDGTLVYLMYRDIDEYHSLITRLKEEKRQNILFCIPKLNVEELHSKVDELVILDTILHDKEVMQEDENLKSEVELRIENVRYDIEQLLLPLSQFDTDLLVWFFNGEELKPFGSKQSLETFLSKWMYKRYPYTLEVRNEAFNKKTVTSVQKKAAISILEQLVKPEFDGKFSIQGFGPDYLIYATLLKNQQYDLSNLHALKNENLHRLREALVKYVQSNERGKILDLYNILLNEPFGMRAPLVPILTVALLKDYWNQMAFYANDFYVTEMSAHLLYEILEQRVEFYEYEIYQLSDETTKTLEALNEVFFQNELPTQPVVIFDSLTSWLRGLPRYTQITNNQCNDIIAFKEAIRHSETDPLEAAYRIEQILRDRSKIEQLSEMKTTMEEFLDCSYNELEASIGEIFKITSRKEWLRWFDINIEMVRNNPVLLGVMNSMKNQEDWLEYLIEKTVGVRLKDWSDITYDSFFMSVKQLLQISDESSVVKIVTGDQTILKIKEVEMSVKGKTVYNNLNRIVQAGGRTMSPDEVKYILYKILTDIEK